jgi:ABC-type nitrate/sulfonate/bicarbonate transport system substrate-binding protein
MDRTRMIFVAIIGVALLAVCGVVTFTMISERLQTTPTPESVAQATPGSGVRPTPAVDLVSPDPIFGPQHEEYADLPTYVCGADAFGSYFTLQQMQMAGIDLKHGFRLDIIPFELDDDQYNISEEQRTALLEAGVWHCLLTTLDSVALANPGVITAIVDESAGADQLWVRDAATINDLRGQRIAFSRGSVGEYFVYYTLSIAQLSTRSDVTLVPRDSVADAVAAFNAGQADAVSGWEPEIYDAEESGGVPLLSSAQMRIVVDVIVTSRQAINDEPDLVQRFHDAWFETLKAQVENFDTAADQIAAWGHNDWTYIYPESAADDLLGWLENVAQADLGDNAFVMRDPAPIINRLRIAQGVWGAAGLEVAPGEASDMVNPGFVSRSAAQAGLQPNARPVNETFSMSASLDLTGVDTDTAATLAVLPCRTFTFLPESTTLTLEARRTLDRCVVPTLAQSVGLFLRVKGSSAWPGPPGAFSEREILEFAEARAQAVVDYLVSQDIDPARFIVEAELPPEEHWESEDPAVQALDRYVEMTLVTAGR